MTLDPFLTTTPVIQIHILSAIIGLTIGPFAIYRSQRDRVHKALGYVWVGAMAVLALSAFWIEAFWSPYYFGPLHLFAVLTLWSLWVGVRAAIRRDFDKHQRIFRSLYMTGLIITGLLTFLPGRTINRMVFGDRPELGWAIIAGLLVWGLYRILAPRVRASSRTSSDM